MMFIQAYDEDSNDDDHLDNIFIDMELSESDYFTAVREFTGDMNKVSVDMTFRVMCQENFYGANCDTLCLAQDDDVNGHYICNGDGSLQCLPGFENTTNNCTEGTIVHCYTYSYSYMPLSIPPPPPNNITCANKVVNICLSIIIIIIFSCQPV